MNLLIFPADIIHYYAVYFVLAIAWLQAGARALLAGMAAVAVLSATALLQLDYSQGWDWASLSYQGLWEPAGFARNLLFNGFHPCCPGLPFSSAACCWHACRWPSARAVGSGGLRCCDGGLGLRRLGTCGTE
ncbi:hypothetical protein [Delftia acidovorans]|uniref:hypothetical protein n=1 Tax=Delftia acidovorans TaxID=80866 RepID=UPI001E4348D2|nr:hypothetical protein [Delftia acidovorans]